MDKHKRTKEKPLRQRENEQKRYSHKISSEVLKDAYMKPRTYNHAVDLKPKTTAIWSYKQSKKPRVVISHNKQVSHIIP